MVTVPEDTPVTTPLPSTLAIAALAVLHVPPNVASASVVVPFTHTDDDPVMAAGAVLFTFNGLVK